MSYITPDILSMDEETIEMYIKENDDLKLYEHTLNEINRRRPHVLSEKEEVLLAQASEALNTPSDTFSMLNNADLKLPSIKNEDGEEVDITHGRYITFMVSTYRLVR